MTGGVAGAGPGAVTVFAAMICAGAAAWLLAGRGGPGRVRLLLAAGAEVTAPDKTWPARLRGCRRRWGLLLDRVPSARPGHQWWCLPGGVLLGLIAESVLPVVAGLLAVPLAGRQLRARRAAVAAERREAAVIDLCTAVAGELRAGRLPDGALLAVGAGRLGESGPALLAAARYGGDVAAALREAAREPGAGGLRGVAACWQVSADGGTGLADGLERVAGALRAERDQREELRAQLAGPRATAFVLALLPAFGLLLGSAMGADPLRVLFHSPAGAVLLAAGGLLEWAGLAWVSRLVRAAEEGGGAP